MNVFIPRVPEANLYNRMEFCSKYSARYGADYNGAFRVWQVEALENAKRDLSSAFPYEDLIKHGIIEKAV